MSSLRVGGQLTPLAMTFVLGSLQLKATLKMNHASQLDVIEASTGEYGESLVLDVVHVCWVSRVLQAT